MAENLEVNPLTLPRQCKRPRKYDGGSNPDFPGSPKNLYHVAYYEASDLVITYIKERFDQPEYSTYIRTCKNYSSKLQDKKILSMSIHLYVLSMKVISIPIS